MHTLSACVKAIILLVTFVVSGCPRQPAEKIRRGSLPETLADEEAFYTIRGDFDWERAPLRYPLQIDRLGSKGPISLLWKRDIVVNNLQTIGFSDGYAFGESGPYDWFGEEHLGSWFVVSAQDGKRDVFRDKAEMEAHLKTLGIVDTQLLPSATVLYDFMKKNIRHFVPETKEQSQKSQGGAASSRAGADGARMGGVA